MQIRQTVRYIGGFAMLLYCAVGQPAKAQEQYVFGVFPSLPPAQLISIYAGYAELLSTALEKKIVFQTKSTFGQFRTALKDRKYDIALVQPFDYVEIAVPAGYRPIARGANPLRALFVVAAGDAVKDLEGMRHKRLATPPRTAAVRYLALEKLTESGLRPHIDVTLMPYPNHPACMHAVLVHAAEACVTTDIPLKIESENDLNRFRVIARTSAIPHLVFVAHPRVSTRDGEKIRRALLALNDSKKGRALLRRTRRQSGFVTATDTEYDGVRVLAGKYARQ